MKGTMTRQQAINAKCKDCSYDPYDKGTWKQQVQRCPSVDCPLFEYRPLSEAVEKSVAECPTSPNGELCEGTAEDSDADGQED